jgi:hypothetical protein
MYKIQDYSKVAHQVICEGQYYMWGPVLYVRASIVENTCMKASFREEDPQN